MDQELRAYLEGQFRELRTEMNQRFGEVEGSLRSEMNQRFEQTEGSFASFRAEMNQRFEQVHEDNRHTHVVLEGLRHELHLVAEANFVALEKTDRIRAEILAKMDEVSSYNVLTYQGMDRKVANLDLRVTNLENRANRQDMDVMDATRKFLGKA